MLERWPDDSTLLAIARDMAQPVTSFICRSAAGFAIRWFSLESEINLCGHGSLGAGAALIGQHDLDSVTLSSRYGEVTITEQQGMYSLSLPAWGGVPSTLPPQLAALKASTLEVFRTRDLVVVVDSVAALEGFAPALEQLMTLQDSHALIVTAQSGSEGYALRYFAPKIGIFEDLATGSAHCSLAPYWMSKLNTDQLTAHQHSPAGGYFELSKGLGDTVVVAAQVRRV